MVDGMCVGVAGTEMRGEMVKSVDMEGMRERVRHRVGR